jgi:TetR/AcrR family transcriptional repressor of nem operon
MTKGDETRRQIIEKAAPIFNQHGFAGSSLAELMQATGLQKGGIYRHFKSKEELAVEAFDYALTSVKNLRFAEVDPEMPAIDQLKKFVENFVERRSNIPGGCPLWNTAIDCDDGNPVLRERALVALENWMKRLIDIIERGIQNREIAPEVEPEALASLLISSLEGALVMKRLTNRTEPMQQVAQYLDEILESHAIGAEE